MTLWIGANADGKIATEHRLGLTVVSGKPPGGPSFLGPSSLLPRNFPHLLLIVKASIGKSRRTDVPAYGRVPKCLARSSSSNTPVRWKSRRFRRDHAGSASRRQIAYDPSQTKCPQDPEFCFPSQGRHQRIGSPFLARVKTRQVERMAKPSRFTRPCRHKYSAR